MFGKLTAKLFSILTIVTTFDFQLSDDRRRRGYGTCSSHNAQSIVQYRHAGVSRGRGGHAHRRARQVGRVVVIGGSVVVVGALWRPLQLGRHRHRAQRHRAAKAMKKRRENLKFKLRRLFLFCNKECNLRMDISHSASYLKRFF